MSYDGPKWQPKPGVSYILPGVSYSPGGGGASNASRLESLRAREKELLEEGALGSERHPRHLDAVYEYRALQKDILAIDAPAPEAEPDGKPFMPLLVRQIAEENPHHRRENAKQAVAEILNPNRWKGADGNGKHPALDPASPEHEGWVEGLKVLLEWANTEPEGK